MRPIGTAAELEQRRKEAVRQLRAGARVVDVCRDLGVSKTAVLNWKRAASQGGIRALGATPQHVPQSRLDDRQKQQLQSILRQGAAACGYPTNLWTCARIAEVIKQKFGVDYHPGHVSRILHGIGFSCQKPAVRARERDPAAVEQFRKDTWKQVKRGRRSSS
jgi:transposase